LGGNIQVMFDTLSTALPPVRSGSLRALGVSSEQRSSDLPDVPTIAESGYPEYRVSVWYGIAAPAGLPDDIAGKISASLDRALNDEAFRAQLEKNRLSGVPSAQCCGYQGVHRRRPGQMVGGDQGAKHFIGLRHGARE
jgi:tripartite-type tricarboxylate transporter receptor subunit TctC